MSETSGGAGWWLASDGKWYPPESKPGALPPPMLAPPNAPVPDGSGTVQADANPRSTERIVGFVAAAGIVIGSMLPWATVRSGFGQLSKSGLEGDGIFTLIFGVIAGIGFWVGGRKWHIAALVVSALAAAIGIFDASDISSIAGDSEFVAVDVGAGLILVCVASVSSAAVAIFMLQGPKKSPRVAWTADGPEIVED